MLALERGGTTSSGGSDVGSSASGPGSEEVARSIVIKGFYDDQAKSGSLEEFVLIEYLKKFFETPESRL